MFLGKKERQEAKTSSFRWLTSSSIPEGSVLHSLLDKKHSTGTTKKNKWSRSWGTSPCPSSRPPTWPWSTQIFSDSSGGLLDLNLQSNSAVPKRVCLLCLDILRVLKTLLHAKSPGIQLCHALHCRGSHNSICWVVASGAARSFLILIFILIFFNFFF